MKIGQVVVHIEILGEPNDARDPNIYAARLVSEWQQSEPGKWVMGRVMKPPICYHVPNIFNNGYDFYIVAELEEVDTTFFRLKYQ